jgi:O-acetyl-ADP-ribose deacetylase (regulator of RNase III)
MIETRKGDLLDQNDIDIICHQANIYHTFGGGIALAIKQKYPEAYEADCKTAYGTQLKLGTTSVAYTKDGKTIMNCYTQRGMGASDRNTSYEDITKIFTHLEKTIGDTNIVIGVPCKYGCGLAGGDWDTVYTIFENIFKTSPVKLVIVDFN